MWIALHSYVYPPDSKMCSRCYPVAVLCYTALWVGVRGLINDSQAIQDFLTDYNRKAAEVMYEYAEASWTFNTNITDYNQKMMLDLQLKADKFSQDASRNASQYNLTVMSQSDRRQFIKIMDIGTAAQTNETKMIRLNKITSDMESIYSTATVCLNKTNCVPLDPDLTKLFSESRNYDDLLTAWKGWRDASGRKMKDLFAEYVTLSNEAVKILHYADTGAYWRSWYDTPTFEDDVRALFDQLRPLYEQLHAYARRKLKSMYGADKFPSSGHIPAHLLGNMWAQQWDGLIEELTPFPNKASFDVTDEMVKQNYTALKIFQTADHFFQSLGMIPMPPEFWNKSMLEKPTDGRDVVCHASAWDFYNGKDFRIKQCTVVNTQDLETAHHEMGHIQYYLQYASQPIPFRDGANPGFHEAVGDVMSLSVQTPEHMHTIGLLETLTDDSETDLNYLMSMALQKIAFIPFGFLIDQWRWKVFRGETTPDKYNEEWWNLRCRYQGVSPPVERTSADFDPGAKFHIPANVPYIRYFVSFVIQFQFHKALCNLTGHQGPLHRCDIYNNKEAGKKLSDMLKLGSSKPWTEAMYLLTGQYKMDAQPLMDYFKPLLDYLRVQNENDYGWHPNCPTFAPTPTPKPSTCNNNVNILRASTLLLTLFCFLIFL
ncbi:angiotensin-converting enzyme-like isoform X3 [Biomphalaria glabrata]|uniref:Angiotensin-converting enzyme n=1 Tax=Biomphalaria glabrata TaxID=6526 RepID=A0A9W2YE03_BIOGL|nr:angiotensin-converting enzyme-like isoform X3 [Biomphalaria glabrata]